MTNNKSTKRALASSVMALFLCFAMLLGTTYAWFTDSVESKNNIIQTGKLKIGLEWADGKTNPAAATWNDASIAIFNYDKWEPGYAVARHLKVSNNGTLAFNYQMRIVANGIVTKLADVIDVYYFAEARALARADIANAEYLGTLAEVIGTTKNLSKKINGSLVAGAEPDLYTIVLKMNEDANDDYQNMDLGCTFSVELIATQMADESDAFGNDYDNAVNIPDPAVPKALVSALDPKTGFSFTRDNGEVVDVAGEDLAIKYTAGIGGTVYEDNLDTGYQFEPSISYADVQKSEYRYWHADFVVYADQDVAQNSMMLAGYYDAWCQHNSNNWVALVADQDIAANTEIRLVELLNATVNWEEICNYGNDGTGFVCGAADLTGENVGTTLTVELRLYETTKEWDASSGTANEETGNYIVVGTFTHTFQ